MKSDDVIIKKSDIHGIGIFAARDFKIGEIVLQWDVSNILSEKEVAKLNDNDKQYIAYLGGRYVYMQEPEKYVNHSCDANTTAKQFCDIAKRDIKKGEEITSDYEDDLPPNTYMKCVCGSQKCVGVISNI